VREQGQGRVGVEGGVAEVGGGGEVPGVFDVVGLAEWGFVVVVMVAVLVVLSMG